MIAAIPIDQIDAYWPDVSPLLEKALEHGAGDLTLDYVYNDLKSGEEILLVVWDKEIKAAITMEIVEGRRTRWVNTVLCGGTDADSWLQEWLDAAVRIAEEQEAELLATGRRGWLRKLKPYGFEELQTVVRYGRRII